MRIALVLVGLALTQAPEGNPILAAAKTAQTAKPSSAVAAPRAPKTRIAPAKLDGGVASKADAGVSARADGGVAVGAVDGGVTRTPMTPEVKDLVERLQSFYATTQDFSAGFQQDYTYKAFKRTQTSTGRVIYKKPALMRWEYEKPAPKTFVLAGDRVYALDPEAMLLTRASIATNQLSASVTFLWGKGNLAEEFTITRKPCDACKGTLLQLEPLKPDPRFQRVFLEVNPTSAQVTRSTVVDPDGSQNAISFLNLVTNTGIDAGAFKLVPPPGTQVQDFLGDAPGGSTSIGLADAGHR